MTPEHRLPREAQLAKEPDWIRDFLTKGAVLVLAAVKDDRPTCLPRLYAYDSGQACIYIQAPGDGEMGGAMGDSPAGRIPAAATVFELGRLLPAGRASGFAAEYASVVVQGTLHEVRDPDEVTHGLRVLMEKYAPHLNAGSDYLPHSPDEVKDTTVHRLDIEVWSGKESRRPDDFPGAYRLEAVQGDDR